MAFNRKKLFVIICVVLVAGSAIAGATKRVQRIRTGVWGGLHIRMEIGSRSTSINYDCAKGAINGPLTVDRNGNFNWRGTFTRQRGGPVREDAKPDSQPALYTGSVKGDTMTLSVKLTDTDEDLGTFTLKRGSAGRVFECK